MKPRNINEAKALIEKYRSITPEIIRKTIHSYEINTFKANFIMEFIIGFSTYRKCILCQIPHIAYTELPCTFCLYNTLGEKDVIKPFCVAQPTYVRIELASNEEELLEAINQRILFIQSLIDRYEKENSDDKVG